MYYRAGFVDIYIVFLGFKGECVSNNYMHIIACGQHKNVIHNARIVFNRLPTLNLLCQKSLKEHRPVETSHS